MKIIRSIDDIEKATKNCEHVLVLFNGCIDSTYILKLLSGFGGQVTALAVDLGGGLDRDKLSEIACYFAVNLDVIDGRQLFVDQAVKPAIKAQAISAATCPISLSLSRPVIAKIAVDYAGRHGCDAIIHSANQVENNSLQLNSSIELLGYEGWYGSPYECTDIARDQKIEALSAIGLRNVSEMLQCGKNNLWCRSHELLCLNDDQDYFISESQFRWMSKNHSDRSNRISLTFTAGVPTHVDQEELDLLSLIEKVNQTVGVYGIGVFSGSEQFYDGSRVLELREAPAAMAIMEAYSHLEAALLSKEALQKKKLIEQTWIDEVVAGRWYGVLKEAISGFLEFASRDVSGTVTICLDGGAMKLGSIVQDELVSS